MTENKENIVILLSGGRGNRFDNALPKQFAEVYGKSILEYCIANFNKHIEVSKIIIVSNPDYIDLTRQIGSITKYSKIIDVIEGGKTRGESSFSGIRHLKTKLHMNNVNVLIHDAVRPNTSPEIIDAVVESLKYSRAASVVMSATDTIYVTDNNSKLISIPKRDCLYQAQTPQGFDLDLIFSAYENFERVSRFSYSDDCSILKSIYPTEEISLVMGDNSNLKITFSEDLETFRQLLQKKASN